MELFLLSSVFYQTFYHVPIHQRLPSEEIHFQVCAVSGISNQKIKSLLSHFIGHQGSSAMVFSLFCKTVPAGQITVVGDMKTEGLYHCLPFFEMFNGISVNILCKKHSLLFQFLDLPQSLIYIFSAITCI